MAKKYSCYDGKNLAAVIAGEPTPPKSSWLIQVVDDDDHLTLSAYYMAYESDRVNLKGLTPQAIAQMASNEKSMKSIADPTVGKLLAMKIMDQLPVSRPLGKVDDKGAIQYVPGAKTPPNLPGPAQQYNFIALGYDKSQKLWLPRLMGKMSLEQSADDAEKKADKKSKKKKEQPDQGSEYTWIFSKYPSLDAAMGDDLWLVDARGRGKEGEAIDDKLNESLKKYDLSIDFLTGMLLSTLSKGYVGMRMGFNILPGDALLDKARMIGILAEVRSGPLQGLRWYWDFGPKDSVTVDGYTSSFSWSRPTFGWSFGKNFNSPLVSRIDLVPKIGLVDLDASLNIDLGDGTKMPMRYRVKNALNLGAELGIERNTSWFLARMWGASDIADFGVAIGKDSISSYRGGVDTYWEMGNITQAMKMSLLVFGFGEMITLEKRHPNVTQTNDSSGAQITSLSYTMAFCGLGLTLSW